MEGGRVSSELALSQPGETLVLEVMVPESAAAETGIEVGDTIATVPFWDESMPFAHAVVTGLLRPLDPSTRFWNLNETVLQGATGSSFSTVPLFLF